MSYAIEPMVGCCYKLPDGTQFSVTGIDSDACFIEIRFNDGALEHLEGELWAALPVTPVEGRVERLSAYDDAQDYTHLGVAPGTEPLLTEDGLHA